MTSWVFGYLGKRVYNCVSQVCFTKHPLDLIRVVWNPGICVDLDVHQSLTTTGWKFTQGMWHVVFCSVVAGGSKAG